ncbi:MAG: MlaD family protein [Solirubrobacteraceae bacterium]
MRNRAAVAAIGLVLVAIIVIALSSRGGGNHTLHASFENAIQMTPGQQVRIAGRPVGEISSIKESDGQAVVDLKITDGSVWPLAKGTYAVARWGSTTAYLGRYTELIPAPAGNPPLPDGGILTSRQDSTAFELDQAYNIFRGRTANDASTLLNRLGNTLQHQGRPLQQGLAAAPGGLNQTADLLQQLSANDYDLRALAQAGDQTLGALAARSGELSSLVTNAAGTFTTFAQHTSAEQQALDRAPRAFDTARSTFARLDSSLDGLNRLVNDLRPGAPALARLAGTTASALITLRSVAPQATATLRDGITAAPALRRLFTTGTSFMPPAGQALKTFSKRRDKPVRRRR